MRYRALLLHLFFTGAIAAQQSLPPVGLWREQLPYKSVIDLAAGEGRIYAATPYSLFVADPVANSLERLSRITGLSETGISAIAFDETNKKLFIAYSNSNIDIIYRNDIINIPDVKRDNIIGDKTIFQIYPWGGNYYLATGLGIIVVDGEKYEVKDTWLIGNNAGKVKVEGFTSNSDFFYAATAEGLKRAPKNVVNLADFANWDLLSGSNGLAEGSCRQLAVIDNRVVVLKDDSLFIQQGANWNLLYNDGWPIVNITASGNSVSICQRKISGESKVVLLNEDGVIVQTLIQPSAIANPYKALQVQNEIWIADRSQGLSRFNGTSFDHYLPDSPDSTAGGEMLVQDGILYATAGEVSNEWQPQGNRNGLYIFKEGHWANINRRQFASLDTVADLVSVAIDKLDQSIWAGAFGGGLIHIRTDQSIEIFKQTVIGAAMTDPSSYRVSGIAADGNNNLWISNYGAVAPLIVRKKDGGWARFGIPYSLPENGLTQIIIDDNNYKWIVAAKGGGLLCFDEGASVENTADDRWKRLLPGAGNGNMPDDDILCLAKDKSGFIWIGTGNGIAVLQCPEQAFTVQGCEAIWPIVQQGSFAGYLFSGEEVKSIAVDGADRKWVATAKGVWLISAGGDQVVYQFTETNSPLLSNDVKRISIDGKTGEVFFATAKGICSFRSTATEGVEEKQSLLVFPNPVPPGYSGNIAIRGLLANAIVKITELDGRLVWQARALGGQVVWDGRDYKGRKISSGVYLVLAGDNNNPSSKAKAAAKIVFIQK